MNRISEKFALLQQKKKIAFMPFVVAGDPNFKASLKTIKILCKKADLLELGFPYSDPLADGPVIQAADNRALQAGINTRAVFKLVKEIRKFSNIPITVLVYANLVYQQGINNFYRQAFLSGIDGVLIPDVPVEEAEPYVLVAKKNKVLPIFLVAQTTTPHRLKKILKSAMGFLYLVSVLGVTGRRQALSPNILSLIKMVKKHTRLPLAVGFGVSSRAHIKELQKAGASGAIMGSALIEQTKSAGQLKNYLKKLI